MNQKLPTLLITGASGFIGSHLLPYLLHLNYRIYALTRHLAQSFQHENLQWIDDLNQIDQPLDYVVNLAGENIGQRRWTKARKQALIDSRIKTTQRVFEWLLQHQQQPKRIVSASAIGYYGIDESETWQQVCDEQSPPQSIFMSELCQQWEKTALSYTQFDTKIMRLGVVFAKNGGILPQMLLPIKLNTVGVIGSGRQPVVWVHIEDVLAIIEFLLHVQSEQIVFNAVAPDHTTQKAFVKTAAQQVKRRPFLPAPACLFKTLLGEQSQLILNGQFVAPKALLEAGYQFKFPALAQALQDIYP
ncbi:TIGR01777 family oxidoreductase [Acinetobacter soli]|uniref:TIGR01777 family oxidoreductase n=1 Tax=Acinetobacter soli TaxID=487316 RepID=UPI0012505199|nr:TIGR01777 family oxidoreductase [Acinetobacter soli]MDQ9832386.1 TIGR01777 family oxidoreductase [Acinetobacter soli]